jgi:flavorubredoxin
MNFPNGSGPAPVRIAGDTWLIPNSLPAGADLFVPVNSMVITGAEPTLIDTGAPVHRDGWLDAVFSVVDPADVRWVFLSHDDIDHVGNLQPVLDACPEARIVASFFMCERMAAAAPLPLSRLRWLEPRESLDIGDRRLHAVLPPLFDAPATRGFYDDSTGVLWAADCFAALAPGPVHFAEEIPAELYHETFRTLNSMAAPWHALVHRGAFRAHADAVEALGLIAVASAHGPILTGPAITDGFDRVRALAGAPVAEPPRQAALDALVASALE